jgi:DNA-binding MarR family transcriptional regulator
MKSKKLKEAAELQFDLLNLFHKNFAKIFHEITYGPYNLNKNQKRAIIAIGRNEEIIPSVLGEYLDLQRGSLTSIIDSLEKEGLIFRKGDPEDRRKTILSLTKAGKEYRSWLNAAIQAKVSEILDRLDEEEIDSYREGMENMIMFFEKLDERA